MTTDVSLNGVTEGLANEGAVDLSGLADEPGGAWPKGWYSAEIIEGYSTGSGKQFVTEDTVSQRGDSRNLRLCFAVFNGEQTRTLQEVFNYRPSDFTPERVAFITEARKEFKDMKTWPDRDAQRSSLAIAKLGQLQKAAGLKALPLAGQGINAAAFVSVKPDIYLGLGDNGYNQVTQFAPSGTKKQVKKSA